MRRWIFGAVFVAALIGAGLWYRNRMPAVVEEVRKDPVPVQTRQAVIFEGKELARQELLAGLAFMPGQGFPATLPWSPLQNAGAKGLFPLEVLLHHQPIVFLEWCQSKYTSEVKGYTCLFRKRERVKGKLLATEKVECQFREDPFSVRMNWLEGEGAAKAVLYDKNQNPENMLARSKLLPFIVVSRPINGPDAKESSRFPISEFGINLGTISTLASMRKAHARGALHVRYDGVFKVPELGDRPCHKLVRTPYDPLEDDELNELTLYIDQETWLQVGSVLKDIRGELISEYWFRDVRLNPEFKKDQFTRGAL